MANTESSWQQALEINHGDYAYASDGGMLSCEEDGTYTLRNGNLQAACAGNWEAVERTGLSQEDIPDALNDLNMSPDGWSHE